MCKEFCAIVKLTCVYIGFRINPSTNLWIVISGLEVIETGISAVVLA